MILEHIYTYCVDNKYIKNNICVLCADGVKPVYKIPYNKKNLII